MNFISDFISFTAEYESPTNFWRWSAYAAVAAILRDSVYIEHGLRKTFPNIFVVLLADSAEYRKSGPFQPITDLLESSEVSNTKVIQGRASVQAIIEEMSQDIGNKRTGKTIKGGSCLLLAEELASFFVSDPQLVPMITDMYDYKAMWEYSLKGAGKTVIKGRCVTFLAASNETFLREVYDARAVFGGLLGRTFMVKPDERRKANALLRVELGHYDKKDLIKQLSEIKNLKGAVTITEEAIQLYEEWYVKLYDSYSTMPDRAGITQRIHAGALKIALILAASECKLEVNADHMSEAILRVTGLRGNYEIFAMKSGKSDQAEIGTIFLTALWREYKENKNAAMSRRKLLLQHWMDFGSEELDKLVITLEQAGLIRSVHSANEICYQMTPKCLEIFKKKEGI